MNLQNNYNIQNKDTVEQELKKQTWIIFGLGNPGARYERTRHNAGWWAIDTLRYEFNSSNSNSINKDTYTCTQTQIEHTTLLLVRSNTFVNACGIAIRDALYNFNVSTDKLILIYDDIHILPSRIRIRRKGGDGGHNGIKSVIHHLATQHFIRIRIGIGKPPARSNQISYVLDKLNQKERELIQNGVIKAVEATKTIINSGVEESMKLYNGI